MDYDTYLSSSTPSILVANIWSLVFQSIIFRMYLTFVIAIILLLKHATLLLSGIPSRSVLTHADQHYQGANMDLKIQEHLAASSQKLSVEQLASFIVANDIGWFPLFCYKLISSSLHRISSGIPCRIPRGIHITPRSFSAISNSMSVSSWNSSASAPKGPLV